MRFKKIAIIGVGLIGGSIGLAIKKRRCANEVIGVFRRSITLRSALKRKAVNRGVMDAASGVKDADLIIIASPVHLIPELAVKAAKGAKTGAIITDVGSTKEWIVEKVEYLLKRSSNVSFVGSHPMAGSEHTGVEFADEGLFEGSPCIVTMTPRTNINALAKVVSFWKSLNMRVKVMSPHQHDRTVSLISHLPHMVAFTLADTVPGKDMECAAEGFRDTTRIASSDPELWADIFLTNKKAVLDAGRIFNKRFVDLLKAIAKNDRHMTIEMLKHSKLKHDKFIHAR